MKCFYNRGLRSGEGFVTVLTVSILYYSNLGIVSEAGLHLPMVNLDTRLLRFGRVSESRDKNTKDMK